MIQSYSDLKFIQNLERNMSLWCCLLTLGTYFQIQIAEYYIFNSILHSIIQTVFSLSSTLDNKKNKRLIFHGPARLSPKFYSRTESKKKGNGRNKSSFGKLDLSESLHSRFTPFHNLLRVLQPHKTTLHPSSRF